MSKFVIVEIGMSSSSHPKLKTNGNAASKAGQELEVLETSFALVYIRLKRHQAVRTTDCS